MIAAVRNNNVEFYQTSLGMFHLISGLTVFWVFQSCVKSILGRREEFYSDYGSSCNFNS